MSLWSEFLRNDDRKIHKWTYYFSDLRAAPWQIREPHDNICRDGSGTV
jgi:hypothetical protein